LNIVESVGMWMNGEWMVVVEATLCNGRAPHLPWRNNNFDSVNSQWMELCPPSVCHLPPTDTTNEVWMLDVIPAREQDEQLSSSPQSPEDRSFGLTQHGSKLSRCDTSRHWLRDRSGMSSSALSLSLGGVPIAPQPALCSGGSHLTKMHREHWNAHLLSRGNL